MRLYLSPCSHPTKDIVAGLFLVRGVARLCDVCLALLYQEQCERDVELDGLELSARDRARAIAEVLGVVDPSPRDLELLPIAAAIVARCDDVAGQHGVVCPPWGSRGTTGDAQLDRLRRLARLRTGDDSSDLDAAIDRVVEVAS